MSLSCKKCLNTFWAAIISSLVPFVIKYYYRPSCSSPWWREFILFLNLVKLVKRSFQCILHRNKPFKAIVFCPIYTQSCPILFLHGLSTYINFLDIELNHILNLINKHNQIFWKTKSFPKHYSFLKLSFLDNFSLLFIHGISGVLSFFFRIPPQNLRNFSSMVVHLYHQSLLPEIWVFSWPPLKTALSLILFILLCHFFHLLILLGFSFLFLSLCPILSTLGSFHAYLTNDS